MSKQLKKKEKRKKKKKTKSKNLPPRKKRGVGKVVKRVIHGGTRGS